MKKLIYYVLVCAIIVSHSTIIRATDTDSASDELNSASRSTVNKAADPDSDPDELNQECPPDTKVTKEGVHGGVLYVKRSRLHKILLSSPGKYEAKGFPDPFLNGFKYVRLNNEVGEEEMYILLRSLEEGESLRFPKGKRLIPCSFVSLFPAIPAWGVSVYDYIKGESSKEKRSHRKHRSKRKKKVIS